MSDRTSQAASQTNKATQPPSRQSRRISKKSPEFKGTLSATRATKKGTTSSQVTIESPKNTTPENSGTDSDNELEERVVQVENPEQTIPPIVTRTESNIPETIRPSDQASPRTQIAREKEALEEQARAEAISAARETERLRAAAAARALQEEEDRRIALELQQRNASMAEGSESRVNTTPTTSLTQFSYKAQTGKRKATENDAADRDDDGYTIPKKQTTVALDSLDLGIKKNDDDSYDVSKASPEFLSFLSILEEINGQDVYSNETQALGRLNPSEYLALPSDLATPLVPIEDVGTSRAYTYFPTPYPLIVYALNKERCPDPAYAVKYALIRTEAVKLGWYVDQKEVVMLPTPANVAATIKADIKEIRELMKSAAMAAWLVPFAAEHIFRTQGHHYITGQATEYAAKYKTIFTACIAPDVADYMPPQYLYHSALHWVAPYRVQQILTAKALVNVIPDAIKIRRSSAPAGTALITTTKVVFDAIDAGGMLVTFRKHMTINFDKIIEVDKKIREDPPKYHKVYNAYKRSALTVEEQAEIDAASNDCAKFAPIAKAFVTVMMAKAPLGKQKVLDKRSEENPALNAAAASFFKARNRVKPQSIEEIFFTNFGAEMRPANGFRRRRANQPLIEEAMEEIDLRENRA